MAQKTIVYWRDIPAQIIVEQGRTAEKRELPPQFIQAIDRTAMKIGAKESDAYLAEWRARAHPKPAATIWPPSPMPRRPGWSKPMTRRRSIAWSPPNQLVARGRSGRS